MAETYWITFSIAQTGNHEQRYQDVLAELRKLTSDVWWTELSHFILFNSNHAIEDIAIQILARIDYEADFALISRVDAQEARFVGHLEDALLHELMPYVQKVGP